MAASVTEKKIAIHIVAYNAVRSLRRVLDRIPPTTWARVSEVFVFDDSSDDDTFLVGLGYKNHHDRPKLSVFRNASNRGYGGNQKLGYQLAIERGYDIVALLHGDGQYAPELLPELIAPVEQGSADAVFGSRMLATGAALRGGMPLYKFVGNKILTGFENMMLGANLSEFHSGYRVYSVDALKRIPFHKNTDQFHFDTQIIIQLLAAGMKIKELPIPTYYGDEISHVNGMRYARDVVDSVVDYKLHSLGARSSARYQVQPRYTMKLGDRSSHRQLLDLCGHEAKRILDVGCGDGGLANALVARRHEVTGVDLEAPRPSPSSFEFIAGDVSAGIPVDLARRFDIVLLADVLEHVADPQALLRDAASRLDDDGVLLVSLPNTVHWSVRAQVLAGSFDYTDRGILDRGHLRLFTHKSALQLFDDAGLTCIEHHTTTTPWERVLGGAGNLATRALEHTDGVLGGWAPNLFAYQNLYRLQRNERAAEESRGAPRSRR